MKKIIAMMLGMVICLTACGDSSSTKFESSSITVEEVLENGMTEAELEASDSNNSEEISSQEAESDSSATGTVNDSAAEDKSTASGLNTIESASNADSAAASGSASSDIAKAASSSSISGAEGIDVDLTVLSSTMVYSQVYDMVYFPENYVGQTVKMEGIYTHYHDDTTGKDYYACFIQDATACCAQGIEFELTDDYVYPDDYPEEGGYVCVSGTFDIYEEDGFTYCTLRNSTLCE